MLAERVNYALGLRCQSKWALGPYGRVSRISRAFYAVLPSLILVANRNARLSGLLSLARGRTRVFVRKILTYGTVGKENRKKVHING